MGKKRKPVPAALHSELSEYASLLRVLRTSNTLDVVSHLTRLISPAPAVLGKDPLHDRESERPNTPVPSREPSLHTSTHDRLQSEASTRNVSDTGKPRDTWTRWPLPAADVPVPEWNFEDEVLCIAKQAISSLDGPSFPKTKNKDEGFSPFPSSRDPSEDVDIDALLPMASVHALAGVSAAHLERILASMASFIPVSKKSAQLRHKPVDWQDVLAIVSAAGLVDSKSLRDVHERLESIYGPSPGAHASVERAALRASDEEKLSAMLVQNDIDFLHSYGGERPLKRKRGKYKTRRKLNDAGAAATSDREYLSQEDSSDDGDSQ